MLMFVTSLFLTVSKTHEILPSMEPEAFGSDSAAADDDDVSHECVNENARVT